MAIAKLKASEVQEIGYDEGKTLPTLVEVTAENIEIEWGNWDRAFLVVENTAAADKKVTVKASDENPPGIRKGLGDLVETVTKKTVSLIPIESTRHLTKAGKVVVSAEAPTEVKIGVVYLKKSTA